MSQGETTTKVSREQAESLFKAKLKQKKDDFDKVTKKLLNYETRTLVDKSKIPEFRGELVLVYNELIAFIHVNFDLFNENSKRSLCEYINECRRRVGRCCDALHFTVEFPNETLELIDQTAIHDNLDDTQGASTSSSQSKQKRTVDEIDDSIIEDISMVDDQVPNTENLNSSKMALTQEAKDYFRLANQIVNIKFMGEPTELAAFIDQIDLLDSLTEEAQKVTLIKFLLTRMGGKARDALLDNIDSVEAIKECLKTHIKPDSSQVIEGKILALHIDRNNMTKFAEKAEKLAEELKRSLVIEGFSKEKAHELTIRKTVEMCRKNSKNETVKAVLSASTYKNPNEVISAMLVQQNIVKDEKKDNNNKFNKFDKNKNFNNNKRGNNNRGRGNFRNNYNNNQNNNNNNDNRDNRNNNNNNRGRGRGGYNNRGYNNNNNNQNNYNREYNRNNTDQNVRFVSGNDQIPSQGGSMTNEARALY